MRNEVTRRSVLAGAAAALAASAAQAEEGRRIVLGALRFTSSGPVFLAVERGYLTEEGLSPEIAFFQDAPTIATATAGGEVTFGIAALTAAFYNLAAENRLKILAGQAQEKAGHPGNLILVNAASFAAGNDSLDKLFARPFGLTQLGSPSHYQLGQLADAAGVDLSTVPVQTFQKLPALAAALTSGAVDWAIIAPPIASDLIASGAAVSIGPYSDHGSFQFGAVFAESSLIDAEPDLVRRFLRGYLRGLRDYARIVTDPTSPAAQAAAEVVGRTVYPDLAPDAAARQVLASALYVDPDGNLDVADIARQIAWYQQADMLRVAPSVEAILRLDLLEGVR